MGWIILALIVICAIVLLAKKKSCSVTKEEEKKGAKKVKDPVCGMDVDPDTASSKSEHMGKTFYFCAPACKEKFDQEPTKYM